MNIFLNIVKQGDSFDDEVRRHFGNRADPRIFVLNGHSRDYWASASDAPFSIKSMPQGGARYRLGARDHHLAGESALLVNGDQPYEMEFRAGQTSQSFCVFYDDALVRAAWGGAPPETPNLVFRPSHAFARKLAELRAAMRSEALSPARLEEHLLELLAAAVETANAHRGQTQSIPARGAAVRAHLLAKLDHARSVLEDDPVFVDLDALAAGCGLSKFHLLRLFKSVYGLPPMAYAKRLRMERAADLLARTKRPVAGIAETLGYEHQSAFARAFQAYAGVSPARFRSRAN